MNKKIITGILCASILFQSKQEAKPNLIAGVCLVMFASLIAGCVVVTIRACEPKWYCLHDPDANTTWSQATTTRAAAINGYKIIGGPYENGEIARTNCPENNDNIRKKLNMTALSGFEVYLQKSTNLVDWVTVAKVIDDGYSGFEQTFTNSLAETTVFYRAMEN